MATASQRIDGLVSGLSTSDIISQLMQLEKQPQVRLQQSRTSAGSAITAYQSINSKVDALRTAADALADPTAWGQAKATSTDPTAVAVTASATAPPATLDFTVDRLAAAHIVVSDDPVGSPSSVVANGTITITTVDGVATSIPVGDGSLASVVAAVNASGTGVRAAAVKTADGAYRLQLTAAASGAASAFSVDLGASALGGMSVLRQGQDARLVVGDPNGTHYQVTSASNTVADVLPGVAFTLARTGAVRVDVTRDDAAIADRVEAMVAAANAALDEISARTAWVKDATTQAALVGDGTARDLSDDILASVTAGGSAAAAGVQLTRDGRVSVDRPKLLAALDDDPDGVAALFAKGGSASTPSLSVSTAGIKAQAGTYGVIVTSPALHGTTTGVPLAGGVLPADERIEVTVGTTTVSYDAVAGATLGSVASGLQTRFAQAGLSLVAEVADGALTVRTATPGSGLAFTVGASGATGLALGRHEGADVAGSFTLADGTVVAGVGNGATLTAPSGHAVLDGLAVKVAGMATGPLGTVTYAPGLAQRLQTVATGAVEASTGRLARAIDGRQRLIDELDDRIDDWDRRLELKEAALSRQYSALEVALGKLQNQSSWLSSQLANLS